MPATGWTRPQIRFWTASARANTARSQPRSTVIGSRKRPKLWRMPMLRVRTNAPEASTNQALRAIAPPVPRPAAAAAPIGAASYPAVLEPLLDVIGIFPGARQMRIDLERPLEGLERRLVVSALKIDEAEAR